MSDLSHQLSADEARVLTNRIKSTAETLWSLVLEAHDREAWKALGYPSFVAYIKAECDISSSHAYRLLDQGRVIRALEGAAGSPVGEISERVARDIKPKLALVTAEIEDRIQTGEMPVMAVQTTIADQRNRVYLGSRKRVNRSNRIIANIAMDAEHLVSDFELIDMAALDETCIAGWAHSLRTAAREITKVAARLEGRTRRRA